MAGNFPKSSPETKINSDRVIPTHNKWKSLPINIFAYMFIGLILLFGTCGIAQATGKWSTSGLYNVSGQRVTVTGIDPLEIKGSMSIQEVIAGYKIPWEEFRDKFKLPADTSLDSKLNTLEKVAPGFSVESVRTWLAERLKK